MDNNELLDKVYKRMLSNIQGRGEGDPASMERVKALMTKDQTLRKNIADLFVTLNELNDPQTAIQLLAEHIAIMVEMLNEFKKGAGK
jgi:hypothetical protein